MSLLHLISDLDGVLKGGTGREIKLEKEDVELTISFLECYPILLKTVKDYEATGAHLLLSNATAPKSLLAYAALRNNGGNKYSTFKELLKFIQELIDSLHDPYEKRIMQMLYIEGLKFGEAREIMRDKPMEGFVPLSETVFADRRRKAVNRITLSLKIIGVLEILPIELVDLQKEIGLAIMHKGWHRQQK